MAIHRFNLAIVALLALLAVGIPLSAIAQVADNASDAEVATAASNAWTRTMNLDQQDRFQRESLAKRHLDLTVVEDGPTSLVLELKNRNQLGEEIVEYHAEEFLLMPPGNLPFDIQILDEEWILRDPKGNYLPYNRLSRFGSRAGQVSTPKLKPLVKITDQGDFRGWRLGWLNIKAGGRFTTAEFRGYTFAIKSAKIALIYREPNEKDTNPPPIQQTQEVDIPTERFLQKFVLNKNQIPAFYQPTQSGDFSEVQEWADLLQTASENGPLLRMRTHRSGIHRLPARLITKAGIDYNGLRIPNLRLYFEGKELPLAVPRKGINLDADDDLYFYVPEVKQDEKKTRKNNLPTERALWLLSLPAENSDGAPPLRLASRPVTHSPNVGPETEPEEGLVFRERFAKFEEYDRTPVHYPRSTRWYWKNIEMGEFAEFDIEINKLTSEADQAKLLVGIENPKRPTSMNLVLYINGIKQGTKALQSIGPAALEYRLNPALLNPGRNIIALMLDGAHPARHQGNVKITDITLEVEVPGKKIALGPEFRFQDKPENTSPKIATNDTGTTDPLDIEAAQKLPFYHILVVEDVSVDKEPVLALDISDPYTPETLVQVRSKRVQYLKIEKDSLPSKFVTASRLTAYLPDVIEQRSIPAILERGAPAAEVVIYPPSLTESSTTYLESKLGSGGRAANSEDIYDLFAYGKKTPEAIKDFLQYTQSYWAKPAPLAALLIGESSDYSGPLTLYPKGTMPNLLPAPSLRQNSTKTYRSDAPYAYAAPSSELPQLIVARISVKNNEEFEQQLAKINSYRENAKAGAWLQRHVFVADDEPEFSRAANNIIGFTPSTDAYLKVFDQGKFPYSVYPRVTGAWRSEIATNELIKEFKRGTLMMNYFGHGGPNLWSHERLLHLSDITKLNNGPRLPLVTCSSCDNAWLDFPLAPVSESMGELLAKNPNGGAIAVFAPTSGAVASEHSTLLESLYRGVLQHRISSIGELTLFSRMSYHSGSSNAGLDDQFVLLGAPQVDLLLPPEPRALKVEPAIIDARHGGTVTFFAQLDSPVWGWGRVTVTDRSTGQKLQDLNIRVKSGIVRGRLPVEANADPASLTITVYAYNEHRSFVQTVEGKLEIATPRLVWEYPQTQVQADSKGADLATLTFPLSVHNDSPLSIRSGEVNVYRKGTDRPIFQRRFPFKPNQRREIEFQFPFSPGIYPLEVVIKIDQDEPNLRRYNLTATIYNSKAAPDFQLPTDLLANLEKIGDNPFSTTLPVHNIGGNSKSAGHENIKASIFAASNGERLASSPPKRVPGAGQVAELILTTRKEDFFPVDGNIEIHLISIEAEDEEEKLLLTQKPTIEVKSGPDLIVVPGSIKFGGESFRQGTTIFVGATIRNEGDAPSTNFTVGLYQEEPWVEAQRLSGMHKNVAHTEPPLAPGEERFITLRWENYLGGGVHNIFVVANSDRRMVEQNLTNNSAYDRVRIREGIDLGWTSQLTSSRSWTRRGERIDLSATVENSSEEALEGVLITGTLGSASGAESESTLRIDLKPGASETITLSLEAPVGASYASLSVNPRRTIYESEYDNNAVSTEIIYPKPASLLTLNDDGTTLDFKPLLRDGSPQDSLVYPDGRISPTPEYVDNSIFQRFRRELVEDEFLSETETEDEETDNQWSIDDNLLTAHPRENAEPIRLSIPAQTGYNGLHSVGLRIQSSGDMDGFPASILKVRVEDELDYRELRYLRQGTSRRSVVANLGLIELHDGVLDLVVDDSDEAAWAIVHGFEFAPVASSYTSVPVETSGIASRLGTDEVRFVVEAETPQSTSIEFAYRLASLNDDGSVTWSEWIDDPNALNDEGTPIKLTKNQVIQWRTKSIHTPDVATTVRRVIIRPAAAAPESAAP